MSLKCNIYTIFLDAAASHYIELKGDSVMSSINKALEPMSSMLNRLDESRMSEHDREIAKAYLRKTEAMLDLIWFVGAKIRAAIAGVLGMRSRTGTGVSSQKRIAAHLQ
jgi:hypothetical protein